jgi:predicted phage baseplate assembly protein
MAIPSPNLDDLRFQQDLVDEARKRIIQYCPEWTDYNLSDPGITLIELFAWMTEQMLYRLNRVPDKNYIHFLNMLGVQLLSPSPARTTLTFRLAAPLPLNANDDTTATISEGIEVATLPSDDTPEVIFTTDERLVIRPPQPIHLRREVEFHKNYLPRLGIETFYAFNRPPNPGDTFYLGFEADESLKGHILRLSFECEPTQATGIKREDPPLVWECSTGDGRWAIVEPSTRPGEKDSTGGLNNPSGNLTLYLPLEFQPDQVRGLYAHWLRCRFETRRPEQGAYTQSPRIVNLQIYATGAAVTATNAVYVQNEYLGTSTGDPGQHFQLQNYPILPLNEEEMVLVEERRPDGEYIYTPWKVVKDFADSTPFDRHVVLDKATGELQFGPNIRQPDGSSRQYGRVPELNRRIMFSQYRYGGGAEGNVPAGKIQILRSAIPYVDQVSNLVPASGGRSQETLAEAQMRAKRELRAQQRAVTAEDFENLTLSASREVTRVKCNAPGQHSRGLPSGMVELLIVPAAAESLRRGDLSSLRVDQGLMNTVKRHIDQYRLLTTTLQVREPHYIGVRVEAEIVPQAHRNPILVRQQVLKALYNFICPVALNQTDPVIEAIVGGQWQGWVFGRDLYRAEIFSLLQQIDGVKHVLDVELYTRPVIPSEEISPDTRDDLAEAKRDDDDEQAAEDLVRESGLTRVDRGAITVDPDCLLCSLTHDVQTVDL